MSANLFAGLLSGFALIVAIGAQNAFVLRQGIRKEHVLPIALICASADALLIGAGIAGLGSLIKTFPYLLACVRFGGAIFLLWHGYAAAQRVTRPQWLIVENGESVSIGVVLTTCLAFTFLNPHVYLDTVILLGSLANQRGESGRWWFGAGAALASVIWFFSLAYGARVLAPIFKSPKAWQLLDGLVALIMSALGVSLLFVRS